MPAAAGNPPTERIDRRRTRSFANSDVPHRQPRVDVQRNDVIDAIERAIVDHSWRAAQTLFVLRFLGRLKQEPHIAAQIAFSKLLFEQVRHAKQNGGVRIVPAGVHDPRILRGKRQTGRFVDRQRVHVGADADRWSSPVPSCPTTPVLPTPVRMSMPPISRKVSATS